MLLNRPRAESVMDRHGLDGLVAAVSHNIRYLTDFEGLTIRAWQWRVYAVLPRREDLPPTLIISGADLPRLARYPVWVPQVRIYGRPGLPTDGSIKQSFWARAD